MCRWQRAQFPFGGLPIKQALRRNLVAYVPQAEEVDWAFPVLVEDVVMMGRYMAIWDSCAASKKADHDAVNEALERVNMLDFRKRQIGELSGGQRKTRVSGKSAGAEWQGHPA